MDNQSLLFRYVGHSILMGVFLGVVLGFALSVLLTPSFMANNPPAPNNDAVSFVLSVGPITAFMGGWIGLVLGIFNGIALGALTVIVHNWNLKPILYYLLIMSVSGVLTYFMAGDQFLELSAGFSGNPIGDTTGTASVALPAAIAAVFASWRVAHWYLKTRSADKSPAQPLTP